MSYQTTIEEALQTQQDRTVFCRRCGRKLKSEQAKQLGFGPSCYKKHIAQTTKSTRRVLFPVNKGDV